MAALPPSSLPPSHPTYRHLGTAGVDRSVRVQMIIALVAGLVMVAVPLYLWRRPRAEAAPEREVRKPTLPMVSVASPTALDAPPSHATLSTETKIPGLLLAEPKIIKCGAGQGKIFPEQCDRQNHFEELLMKTLRDSPQCAPEKGASGTINYVLDIDHKTKKLKLWAGKSSTMKRTARKKVVHCINQALPPADWAQVIHQHPKYQISILATYP
ncbi:MAG: hypothetical protein RMJ98_03725 [Myxococcales bacterium]|nr:hypothetical protein [Polyangiaceae bacterium]MDW8248398.1 hypothetical protein [Myxococcales bacterium]